MKKSEILKGFSYCVLCIAICFLVSVYLLTPDKDGNGNFYSLKDRAFMLFCE